MWLKYASLQQSVLKGRPPKPWVTGYIAFILPDVSSENSILKFFTIFLHFYSSAFLIMYDIMIILILKCNIVSEQSKHMYHLYHSKAAVKLDLKGGAKLYQRWCKVTPRNKMISVLFTRLVFDTALWCTETFTTDVTTIRDVC